MNKEQRMRAYEAHNTLFDAAMICEGTMEVHSEEENIEAWQYLVDTGQCWRLQGWFGRTARDLIETGKVEV